ncbi:transferase [Xylaria acuta]|nr:transferase [Xylaria acuta]
MDATTEHRVRVIRRVFSANPPQNVTATRLSIVDATVSRFSACGLDANDPTVFDNLESGTINPRYVGRPVVIYGSSDDPGVEMVIADDGGELHTVVPSLAERSMSKRIRNASSLRQSELLPGTNLAFSNLAEYMGLPGASSQLAAFKCGGFAVSLKLTHCLSDATCLLQKNARSKALFDPRMLHPDAERVHRTRSLLMNRFDWWATGALGYPLWAIAPSSATKPSPKELSQTQFSLSTDPPWPTTLPSDQDLQEQVYLDISLGIRNRVSPPLPDSFVVSPLLLAYITKTGANAATATIGAVAGFIRRLLSQFTPQAVSDYLYDAVHEAYEVDFCGTGLARYVQTQMPLMDGLLQLMDIAETGDFNVSLALKKDTMERLVSDPMLRVYDEP